MKLWLAAASVGSLLLGPLRAQEAYPLLRPGARWGASMAYDDVRDRMVLFGGLGQLSSTDRATWEWDGVRWERFAPTPTPGPRWGHSMAYDANIGRVLLFGGADSLGRLLGDTWLWDGSQWQQVTGVAPSPRRGAAVVWRTPNVLLFGGEDATTWRNDLWTWNGATWRLALPGGAIPGREGAGLVHQPTFGTPGSLHVYGGRNGTGYLGDHWEYTEPLGVPTWGQFHFAPPPRSGFAMYQSPSLMVLFGGTDGVRKYNETFQWVGVLWGTVLTTAPPSARSDFAWAARADRHLFLFGGDLGGGLLSNELWTYDRTTWTRLGSPAPRYDAAMTYDPFERAPLLFGGSSPAAATLGDAHVFEGDHWRPVTVPAQLGARSQHAMATDPTRQAVVLFGGRSGQGVTLGDTWERVGGQWSQAFPANAPLPRSYHVMAYDAARGRTLLFGGTTTQPTSETWEWDGTDWTAVSTTTQPPAMTSASMAYDELRQRIVLVGRLAAAVHELWEYDGIDWTSITPAVTPTPRGAATLTWDPVRGRCVLFGGGWSGIGTLDDLWEWDGTNWRQRQNGSPWPITRERHMAAFDRARGVHVIFGGNSYPIGIQDDTWSLVFPFDAIGDGEIGGGLPLSGGTAVVGGELSVSFANSQNVAVLLIGLSRQWPSLSLSLPGVLCNGLELQVVPDIVLALASDPAVLTAPLPNDPLLAGAGLYVQAAVLQAAGCLRASDAYAATVLAITPGQ